jgi:hypothetical protein
MKTGNNTSQRHLYSEFDSVINKVTGSTAGFVSVFALTVVVLLSMLLQ